jgi:hypothetical protein
MSNAGSKGNSGKRTPALQPRPAGRRTSGDRPENSLTVILQPHLYCRWTHQQIGALLLHSPLCREALPPAEP